MRHISRGHSECANAVGFGVFPGVFELLVQCAKISSLWVGGMCILFEICEKRPFQKCMGGGGGSETIFLQNQGPKLDAARIFSDLPTHITHIGFG